MARIRFDALATSLGLAAATFVAMAAFADRQDAKEATFTQPEQIETLILPDWAGVQSEMLLEP